MSVPSRSRDGHFPARHEGRLSAASDAQRRLGRVEQHAELESVSKLAALGGVPASSRSASRWDEALNPTGGAMPSWMGPAGYSGVTSRPSRKSSASRADARLAAPAAAVSSAWPSDRVLRVAKGSANESRREPARNGRAAVASRGARSDGGDIAKEIRKRFRTAKADKQYDRTIGARERAEEQRRRPASRAAVYQMSMGATHRKSSRMQNGGGKGLTLPFGLPGLPNLTNVSSLTMRLAGVAVVLVFAVAMLYPSFQNYYIETRQLQQLEAEYAALESYNQQMQAQVDYLNTDEGIEDYARSELGWVRSGEHVVSVEGVQSSASTAKTDRLYAISSGSVKAPDTWYSGVLDVVFGYGS